MCVTVVPLCSECLDRKQNQVTKQATITNDMVGKKLHIKKHCQVKLSFLQGFKKTLTIRFSPKLPIITVKTLCYPLNAKVTFFHFQDYPRTIYDQHQR